MTSNNPIDLTNETYDFIVPRTDRISVTGGYYIGRTRDHPIEIDVHDTQPRDAPTVWSAQTVFIGDLSSISPQTDSESSWSNLGYMNGFYIGEDSIDSDAHYLTVLNDILNDDN